MINNMTFKKTTNFTLLLLLCLFTLSGCTIKFSSSGTKRLPSVCEQQKQAIRRDAKRLQDIREIRQALNLYFNDHQVFPDSLKARKPFKSDDSKTTYMISVPRDLNGRPYKYATSTNASSFTLKYALERGIHGEQSFAKGEHIATEVELTNQSSEMLQKFNQSYEAYKQKCIPEEPPTRAQIIEQNYLDIITDTTEINPIEQAKRRDLFRINTIKTLQVALSKYFNDEGIYPKSISFRKPLIGSTKNITYVHLLEDNPLPGGKDYIYQSYAVNKYAIFFTLEHGIDEYKPGDYVTTSKNISQKRRVLEFDTRLATDTDKDGLTDAEEDLYNTDKSLQDTDGDGFPDLEELKKGYSPLKK